MSIKIKKQVAPSEWTSIGLEVVLSGSTITIKQGDFKVDGVDYSLSDDEVFTVTDRAEKTAVLGYLVKEKASEEARVLIDEVVAGEVNFKFDGSPYVLLYALFAIDIPSNSADVSAATGRVWNTVESLEEEES